MLFSGVNKRLDSLKNQNHLQPIAFASKGNITGVQKLESRVLQAGTISISDNGDVTGINNLHATGLIKTESTLELPEFSTGGKVQLGGPVINAPSGYVNYSGVGLMDSEYGKYDPYFTRKYSCILPDVYPPKVYIYSLTSDQETHLTITQGSKTYVYVFPVGRYTSSDICFTFNNTLQTSGEQIPLVMSYNVVSDTFTITVDDNIGAVNEPPPYLDITPSYKEEFTVLGKSILLQRLGLFSTSNAAKGETCSNITSNNRILRSTEQTAFKEVAGFPQGFYSGGVKRNDLLPFWSPATHVWVGSQPSQSYKTKVIKSMSDYRMLNKVGNEIFDCEVLPESSLFRVNATLTSPYFECSDEDTPWNLSTVSSDVRAHYLSVLSVSNKGSVTVVGCDGPETFSDSDILCNSNAAVNIRSRNLKQRGVGPSVSFEGALSNCSDSITECTTYGCVKGIPASFTGNNSVNTNFGGQLVFYTNPVDGSVPLEAIRITENQQVCLGNSPHADENLYTKGNVYVGGSVGISSSLITPKAQVPTFTSVDIVTDSLRVLGESSFDGNVHIVSSQVSDATSTATLTEHLQVLNSSNMRGSVVIDGPHTVSNNSTFSTTGISSTLTVKNNTLLNNTLDTGDVTTFNDSVDIYNLLTISDTTIVESDVYIDGSVVVSETSLFDGVGISTSLTVSGTVTLEGDLDISGSVTISSDSTMDNTVNIDGTVDVSDKITASGDVSVSGGYSKIYNTVYSDPDSGVNRSLKISGSGLAVDGGTITDTLTCYSTSTGTCVTLANVFSPTNTDTDNLTGVLLGIENSLRNCGVLGFKYTGSGSTSNKLVLQFGDDSHDLLSLRADHTAEIDTLTVSGNITVNGKVLPTDIVSTVSLTNIALPTSDANLQSGERIRLGGSGTISNGSSVGIAPNVLWLTSGNNISFYSSGSAIASVSSTGFNGVYPVGSIIWVAFNCINGNEGQTSIPIGYLVSNGAQVSRTTYATLYSVIGTIYGSGDGSTTFNLPDVRGAFIRGYNETSSGYDPSRTFGSSQSDAIRSHNHTVNLDSAGAHSHQYWSPDGGSWQSGGQTRGGGYSSWQATENEPAHNHVASCGSKGSETRPCNYPMVGLIRYA